VGVAPPVALRLGEQIAAIRPHHGGNRFAGAGGTWISPAAAAQKLPSNGRWNGWGAALLPNRLFDRGEVRPLGHKIVEGVKIASLPGRTPLPS